MDFNKFDSVSAAEKGAAMQLKDPATLAPLFTEDGKPCEVILLGSEAPSVRAAMRELQKARANSQDAEGDTDDEGVSKDYFPVWSVSTMFSTAISPLRSVTRNGSLA